MAQRLSFFFSNWKSIVMKLIHPLLRQQVNSPRLFLKQILRSNMRALPVKILMHTIRTSPTICWTCFLTVQSSTGHLKCLMIPSFIFVHVASIPNCGEIKEILQFIMIMYVKAIPWTPNELMKHLSDQGDHSNKAIYIYLEKINPTRSWKTTTSQELDFPTLW